MSAAQAIHMTDAERQERARLRRSWDIAFPQQSAEVINHPARGRKPLGLRPVEGDPDDAPERGGDTAGYREAKQSIAAALAGMPEASREQPAAIRDIFEGLELPLSLIFDERDAVSKGFKELRALIAEMKGAHREEVAELKLTITELRCSLREMLAVQEASRAQSRGERGEQGVRGVPGPQGEAGRAGPKGPKGEIGPVAKAVAWEPNVEAFSLTPVYGDGSRGVSANLRPFFEAYDESTRGDEDEEYRLPVESPEAELVMRLEKLRREIDARARRSVLWLIAALALALAGRPITNWATGVRK
jgi:hypothetical protein